MNIIKNNWAKFKETKIYIWYKGLPVSVVGLTTFLAILVFLTAIFNWFWTGTGSDPTRTFYAPFTNDFKEFQEYATLYIALLAFGATMFAGLAVFLVFNDWKEQHNATVYSNLALESLNNFKKLSYYLVSFRDLEINLKEIIDNNFMEENKRFEAIKNIYENYIENRHELDKLKSAFLHDIIFIAQLKSDSTLLSASLNISTEVQNQLNKLNDYIKNKKTTKLNNNEIYNLILDDNTVFCKIGLNSSKIFIPLIQKYIQQ